MPETITIDCALKLAWLLLTTMLLGLFIGFFMGRVGARIVDLRKTKKEFDPGATDIDESSPYDEALLEPEPEVEERIETIPGAS